MDEIIGRRFSEIKLQPMEALLRECAHAPGGVEIAQAIATSEFKHSHPHSKINILWRFCRAGWPWPVCVVAIRAGFSSPEAFRRDYRARRGLKISNAAVRRKHLH